MLGNTDEDKKKPKKRFWTRVEQDSDSGPDGEAKHQSTISNKEAADRRRAGLGPPSRTRVQNRVFMVSKISRR